MCPLLFSSSWPFLSINEIETQLAVQLEPGEAAGSLGGARVCSRGAGGAGGLRGCRRQRARCRRQRRGDRPGRALQLLLLCPLPAHATDCEKCRCAAK